MFTDVKDVIIALFTLVSGIYGIRLTGKRNDRKSDQELINKLFREVDRVTKDNLSITGRLDSLEKINRDLNKENNELKFENNELKIDVMNLMNDIKTKDRTILELEARLDNLTK